MLWLRHCEHGSQYIKFSTNNTGFNTHNSRFNTHSRQDFIYLLWNDLSESNDKLLNIQLQSEKCPSSDLIVLLLLVKGSCGSTMVMWGSHALMWSRQGSFGTSPGLPGQARLKEYIPWCILGSPVSSLDIDYNTHWVLIGPYKYGDSTIYSVHVKAWGSSGDWPGCLTPLNSIQLVYHGPVKHYMISWSGPH